MNSIKVLVVGAGQLGSRHLQSLASLPSDSHLAVVDPSQKSLNVAKERYDSVVTSTSTTDVEYRLSCSGLSVTEFDVCIVATGAKNRLDVIKAIVNFCRVKYFILEKILFQSAEIVDAANDFLKPRISSVWVNCPRRIFPVYKKIISILSDQKSIHMHVSGQDWGLACNSIHFIDLWSAITRELGYKLSLSVPSGKPITGKRPGYQEFYGEIKGSSGQSGFTLSCLPESDEGSSFIVKFSSEDYEIEVNETDQVCSITKKGKRLEEFNFSLPFQSQLTSSLVLELLNDGFCSLTKYEESALLHKPMLNSFLDFFNENMEGQVLECPIT